MLLLNSLFFFNNPPILIIDFFPGTKYKPFLDLLLELSEDNALTDKEIREEVDTAIVTGFDTSSSLLSYIMILLGTHPQVQEKIYQE